MEGKKLEVDMLKPSLGILKSHAWGFQRRYFWRQIGQGPGAQWNFVSATSMSREWHWEGWYGIKPVPHCLRCLALQIHRLYIHNVFLALPLILPAVKCRGILQSQYNNICPRCDLSQHRLLLLLLLLLSSAG